MPTYVAVIDSEGFEGLLSLPDNETVKAVRTAERLSNQRSEPGKKIGAAANALQGMELRMRFNNHRLPIQIRFNMTTEHYEKLLRLYLVQDTRPAAIIRKIFEKASKVVLLNGDYETLMKHIQRLEKEEA